LLEKIKTTLGWLLDTHWLVISLKMDKYSVWVAPIYFIPIMEGVMPVRRARNLGRSSQPCRLHHPASSPFHEPAAMVAADTTERTEDPATTSSAG
jgi:hypothetical protein